MTPTPDPFQEISAVAPAVGAEWQTLCEGDSLGDSWVHLAFILLDRAQDGRLPDLPLIAPVVETFLDRYDSNDQVSLGVIHAILLQASNRGLDRAAIRASWGPKARRIWDSLAV